MLQQMSMFPNLEQDNIKVSMTKQQAISRAIEMITDYGNDHIGSDDEWSEIKEVVDVLKEIRIYE